MDPKTIYTQVNARYGASARAPPKPAYSQAIASAFGYSASDLSSIPRDSNLGLSCGNPLALASLKPGETVVDLGSGAGFDVFLAAKKVGESGKAIGIDMNPDMLEKARRNAEKAKIENVQFVESSITAVDLPDEEADVVISNCVINLVPDAEKPHVFREIYRILKPGGRCAVSDILAKKDLPAQMKNDLSLYVGCVAGASQKNEYEKWMKEAGLGDVVIVDAETDMNVYTRTGDDGKAVGSGCCGSIDGEKKTESVSCCGSGKPEEEEKKKDEEKPACCGSGNKDKEDGGVVSDMKTNFASIDLNEWVGKLCTFPRRYLEAF